MTVAVTGRKLQKLLLKRALKLFNLNIALAAVSSDAAPIQIIWEELRFQDLITLNKD